MKIRQSKRVKRQIKSAYERNGANKKRDKSANEIKDGAPSSVKLRSSNEYDGAKSENKRSYGERGENFDNAYVKDRDKNDKNENTGNLNTSISKKRSALQKMAEDRGICRFEVEGLNLARLLGTLGTRYGVTDVRVGGRQMRFSVSGKHRADVIALLDNLCYNYKIIKIEGGAPLVANLLKRVGLIVGIMLFATAAAVYPMIVTDVVFDGAYRAEAVDLLTASGIRKGAFIADGNFSALSKQLLALDGIAFASVRKTGTRVVVTLKEELAQVPEIGLSSGAVKAKKRAVVTRVIVKGGTAEVKYGDVVQAGDVLIGDYILVGEEKVTAPALGEVYGNVYYKRTAYFADNEIVKIEGESKSYTRTGIFGKTPEPPKSSFKEYTVYTEVAEYGFLIPYRIYRWTFTEIKAIQRENGRTEEQMKAEAYSALLEEIAAEGVVKEAVYDVARVDGGTEVTVVIVAEERIN